jgi:trans-2,3-dihydro-3-hydroxyanthranilate isomerase
LRLTIVDVFAETKLAGNQLAVVRDAARLSTERMQAIALEMNFSETTFVVSDHAGLAKVRIFTPGQELPFAGHPTLGTAWVLAGGRGEYTLDLAVGHVLVSFDANGTGWIAPPEPKMTGSISVTHAAQLLGLSEDRIDASLPIRLTELGPKFVLVPLVDAEALATAQLDLAVHRRLVADGVPIGATFAFCFAPGKDGAGFRARMFFEANGVLREDPATGSANACFAAYLREQGYKRAIVDQGVEMGRPSRLYLEMDRQLRIGGKVQLVVEGRLID